ncbi:protein ANKUB1 [Bombina bombina]|uniref:protein ANKUB1 n=1 Tax=Bombina bombina TaxID=8345 RepID=UPI00235ACA31|nr:protein ANKUB1 [Bombina bombina]
MLDINRFIRNVTLKKYFSSNNGQIMDNQTRSTTHMPDFQTFQEDYFHIQLSDDNQGRMFLELIFAGGVLRDEWVLTDIGITVCSTIKCVLKEEEKPVLYVFNAVTKEKIPIKRDISLLTTTVSRLKTLVSLKCGLPVSVCCLRTLWGKEMYNCNSLSDYNLDQGGILRLDVWDGWKEFLSACVTGHKHNIQRYLSKEEPVLRFQQRVALYMAAYFGHLDLVQLFLKKGIRADEPIGLHPYREWCSETDHPDVAKCAIHVAAEAGQLLILKAFVAHNVLCIQCQNHLGHTPLKICIQNRHKDCVLYLIMKMWSIVSFPKISLPMKIYIKVKKWLFAIQKKNSATKRLKLASEFRTRIGDKVVVDGFSEPQMTSKSLYGLHKEQWQKVMENSKKNKLLNKQMSHSKVFDLHTIAKGAREHERHKLPPVKQASENPDLKRKKVAEKSVDDDIFQNTHNTWTSQGTLPPIPINSTHPRYLKVPQAASVLNTSLELYSKHSGRSPRENAIYCLFLVSGFKEKPWLQQLDMARMLAKKSIYN